MENDTLLKETLDQVDELFSDTTVSLETTLDRLVAVRSDVEERIRLVKDDIEYRDRE